MSTDDFVTLAKNWCTDAVEIILTSIWDGYDLFHKESLTRVKLSASDRDVERSITMLLEPMIRRSLKGGGFEPFDIQHGTYEQETAMAPPAQPPEYDLAFVWVGNPRVTWPIEAKVLKSDGAVSEYIKEIKGNYLTCRYAPFSSEAGMLGYLLTGKPSKALENISKKGDWNLRFHAAFPKRDSRTSDHKRNVPTGKSYPAIFRCHHFILDMQ